MISLLKALRLSDERYLFALMKMEKWILISAIFLLLDLITLIIDGIFYKEFKDFRETPKVSNFTQKDANELKAPVLAFVVLETITEVMSFAFTIYLFTTADRYVQEKKNWPFVISVLSVLFDFAQTVIALTTAFKMDKMELGDVQFVKPVFGLIKAIFQLPLLLLIYREEAPFTRLIEVENDEKNYGSSPRKRPSCLQWMTFIGNGINLFCSFILLTRVSNFM